MVKKVATARDGENTAMLEFGAQANYRERFGLVWLQLPPKPKDAISKPVDMKLRYSAYGYLRHDFETCASRGYRSVQWRRVVLFWG